MTSPTVRVLLVEDSPTDARLIQHDLRDSQNGSFDVALAGRVSEALVKLQEQQFDVALVDLGLPDSTGFSTFTRIQTACPQLPIVVLTGAKDEAAGAEAIRLGVQDYLVKGDADGRVITRSIRYAIERQRAEAALRKTTEDLERSNKDLEQFAYVASHDLQEPLRTVRSYAQLLGKRYQDKLDADANDFITFIVDGSARMQSLILDLLAYSRVGSQGKPLVRTQLGDALQKALQSLQESVFSHSARVTNDPLPEINGDEGQLTQLFQNLIGNAIKFRREGVPAEVHVGVMEHDTEWLFSVRDNGIGIDDRHHQKIFTIFQRLHTIDKYPGTGIGLAICKRIVEHHGGRIWVESVTGQGATFFFTMPHA